VGACFALLVIKRDSPHHRHGCDDGSGHCLASLPPSTALCARCFI
jgi:hypothetical protein